MFETKLSVIAGETIPIETLFQLLKIDKDQEKEAQQQGRLPIARLDQLEAAM